MEDLNEARRGGDVPDKRKSVSGGSDCLACWEETVKTVCERAVRKWALECQNKKRDFLLKQAEV